MTGGSETIEIRPAATRAEMEAFIRLPDRLYRDYPGYVPPLLMERREALNEKKNPYFEHARVRYWLAWRGERPVGRISAQIDRLFIETYGEQTGHFGFLDAEDDGEVYAKLLETATGWLKAEGMSRVTGPFNLSINQECGMLVEGFEERPTMLLPFNAPYADRHVRAAGFEKAKDLICYDDDIKGHPSRLIERFSRAEPKDTKISVRHMDPKRYEAELQNLLEIFNEAWADNWGFVPFTAAEMKHVAKQMKPIINPRLVWIAEVDDKAACMIVALPNISELIADLDGRLLPFGWAKLLWRLKVKGPSTMRVLLLGLRRKYSGSMLGAGLVMRVIEALRRSAESQGIHHADLSWILEDNTAMRRVIKAGGAVEYKTYRIYERQLT